MYTGQVAELGDPRHIHLGDDLRLRLDHLHGTAGSHGNCEYSYHGVDDQ